VTNGFAVDTYNYTTGDLVISVQDARMNGVASIELWRDAGGTPAKVGASITPAQWTVSADGKQIHIPKTVIAGGTYNTWNDVALKSYVKIITSGAETEDTVSLPIKVTNVP